MDLTVIVRSAYERTEDLCRHLIQQQVSSDQVVVIHEKPSSSALRRAYKIGLDCNRRWTLCVDADVLLRNNAIATLLQSAEAAGKDVLLVKGLILDKLFGGPRPAGAHLYRSHLLEEAIKYIPEEGIDLRLENYAVAHMREQCYGIVQKRVIVGLHDFEQAYRDIFRSCWVHAHTHVHKAAGLLPYWQRMCDENGDPDFAVALHGYSAGLVTPRSLIRIDREAVTTLAKDQLVVMGVDEKPPLAPDALSADDVGLMIEGFQVSPEHRLAHPKYYRRYVGEATARNQKLARLGGIKAQVGWLRLMPWVTGWGLGWVGARLRLWASQ